MTPEVKALIERLEGWLSDETDNAQMDAEVDGVPADLNECEMGVALSDMRDLLSALRAESDRADRAAKAEREACAKVADRLADPPKCDFSNYDYSTGVHECSLEVRGKDCLCMERVEAAEKIAAAIRARTTEKDES